ncbi:predicted protein [Nematostella vectensis]|uniref:DED domain-containing protein n=1 Tax=Nematostella vectensis TaxID=45351 RepID=A7SNU7_NEMVE|nr:uncharacterized protein LOC5505972 [Nematostella vectensis]XP_032230240.1 uncharacterized protein LOC5505972 [Nematostella vectensis]EDO34625.1 predicted protein [Nematostella vectensis]|eukprot:XP_001626725.1 predicted protein [Nematostella vectensis]
MEPRIDPFRSLILSIANDCTDEDVTNMKFLCVDTLPEGHLESVATARDLFTELMHNCYLSKDKRDCLASLLYHIGRHDLRNRLLGKQETTLTLAFQHWGGLPAKVPNFVGRESECQAVFTKLTTGPCQIVTITGPPGFGKSCVAIHVAHELFSLGICVYYLSLRNCSSLSCMANQLLGALGIIASPKPVEQAMHCVMELTKDTVIVLDNAEDMLVEEVRDPFCNYVETIAVRAMHVRLLVTSRLCMMFFTVESFSLVLTALEPEHAKTLLQKSDPNCLESRDADLLVEYCGGVPLVLRTTAALLAKSINPKALIMEFQKSPVTALKNFNLMTLSSDHQIFQCLNISFCRLSPELQIDLISLSLYPTTFVAADVYYLLTDHSELTTQLHLQDLVDNSLLQFDPVSKQYAMHGVIQAFCMDKARSKDFELSYQHAKKVFNLHYLDLLKELYNIYHTKDSSVAGKKFLINRRNIRQAMQDAVHDPELEEACIDFANEVSPFLAKAFRKEKFLAVYGVYREKCKERGDLKRYSDCLTSEAYCILSYCACYMPCPPAVKKFKKANEIQTELGDESSSIRALCLSKLGKCFAQVQELDKGVMMIKKAIAIRETQGDEIFLAVAYKDLAAAYSFNNQHNTANTLRHEKVLPVYLRHLGDHPYTATLMDDMGTAYTALGDYVNAHGCLQEALRMRIKALGDHHETARSYHDLGVVLVARCRYNEALAAFREALRIQEKVLGAHQETVRSHHEIARVLNILGRDGEALAEDKRAAEAEEQAEEFCDHSESNAYKG